MIYSKNKTSINLFRPEVFEARKYLWLGEIRLAQPLSTSILVGVILSIAVALTSFLVFGTYTRKTTISGITVPVAGWISILAPSDGVLFEQHISEGDLVEKGQTLFTISTDRQQEKGELSELIAQQITNRRESLQSEKRLRNQQFIEKQDSLKLRLENLNQEEHQLLQEINLSQHRIELTKKSLSQFETLQNQGYVSSVQTQQKQEELLTQSGQFSSLQRSLTEIKARKLVLNSELINLTSQLESDLKQIERSISGTKQEDLENTNRKTRQVIASKSGRISAINLQVGAFVHVNQVLASLIPYPKNDEIRTIASKSDDRGSRLVEPFEAQVFAPSSAVGFVAPGQKVFIRFAAFPYQKFGLHPATVLDVSDTPFTPNELPPQISSTISNYTKNIIGFNNGEALYRIRIQLHKQSITAYGKEQALKAGMTLEADIVQENRKIWEWILAPVIALYQKPF